MRIKLSLGIAVFLAAPIIFAAACASPQPTQTPAPTATPTSAITGMPSPTLTTPTATISADNWPTYHRDLARSGFDPAMSLTNSIHRLWTFNTLDGDIYAEPLVVDGEVLVATEQDSVYSFDAGTGKVLWHVNLGTPVPLSQLPCGDIDPSGITSTPVADPATGRLYVVARVQPDHHELFALDVKTGSIIFHRSVDPAGADPRVQQQRSALTLINGRVYIAFGGLFGDCGSYHGWLVSAPAEGAGSLALYQISSHTGVGLWAPSGPAVDSKGNIYVTSGNGFSTSAFDFGNSVVRLSPDLTLLDWFAPVNWQELNRTDRDLGSMGPILLNNGLIFQAGKEGVGYLLRANNLGHTAGEAFSAPVCNSAFGGAAYAPPYVFMPCTNGLVALSVSGTSFKVAWSSPNFFADPPVVAGGAVLTLDRGSGTLFGFDVGTGNIIFKIQLGRVSHFTTPSLSQGHIFVAADRQIICLGP